MHQIRKVPFREVARKLSAAPEIKLKAWDIAP